MFCHTSRRAVERSGGAGAGADANGATQLALAGLVLEDLCLSLPSTNEDLVLSLLEWKRVQQSQRDGATGTKLDRSIEPCGCFFESHPKHAAYRFWFISFFCLFSLSHLTCA